MLMEQQLQDPEQRLAVDTTLAALLADETPGAAPAALAAIGNLLLPHVLRVLLPMLNAMAGRLLAVRQRSDVLGAASAQWPGTAFDIGTTMLMLQTDTNQHAGVAGLTAAAAVSRIAAIMTPAAVDWALRGHIPDDSCRLLQAANASSLLEHAADHAETGQALKLLPTALHLAVWLAAADGADGEQPATAGRCGFKATGTPWRSSTACSDVAAAASGRRPAAANNCPHAGGAV